MKRIHGFFFYMLFPILLGTAHGELVFKTREYKVTSGIHDMKMSFEFPFTNNSDKNVEIKRVETSCTCLTAWMEEDVFTVPAKGRGIVHLDIDLGAFGGKVEKEAYVVTSEGERIQLKLSVDVPEFVKIEPRTLKWTVGEGSVPKKIKLVIHKDLTLKLEDVGISQPGFDFQPKTIKEGREYEITVVPKSTDTPGFALLSIKTNAKEPRYKKILGYLSINKAAPGSSGKND